MSTKNEWMMAETSRTLPGARYQIPIDIRIEADHIYIHGICTRYHQGYAHRKRYELVPVRAGTFTRT